MKIAATKARRVCYGCGHSIPRAVKVLERLQLLHLGKLSVNKKKSYCRSCATTYVNDRIKYLKSLISDIKKDVYERTCI